MLELDNVVVSRAGFRLGPCWLSIHGHEVVALTGVNGSGKTTLLDCILGSIAHTGTIRVCGSRVTGRSPHVLREVGYLPDDPEQLFGHLSAYEFWRFVARARSRSRNYQKQFLEQATRLTEQLGFAPPAKLLRDYSVGMKKKAQLIAAMMHSPQLLIMDEPTSGLDPASCERLKILLGDFAAGGGAVLLSTHDIGWASDACSRFLSLENGQLIGSVPYVSRGAA